MERTDWKRIESCVRALEERRASQRFDFGDADIVLTFLWACYFEKPMRWACHRSSWPVFHRRPIPSESTMSRRMRSSSVRRLLEAARVALENADRGGFVRVIDGKILAIAAHSSDPDAHFGGPRGRRRGYEMHSICTLGGERLRWTARSLAHDERIVARDMVQCIDAFGYLLGDSNYHSNPLSELCAQRELQLVAPRKKQGRGLGNHPISAARHRCLAMAEFSPTAFSKDLMEQRRSIETMHANLVSFGGGLHGLPAWVRREHRVHNWVAGKLLLDAARREKLRLRKA